MAMIVMTMIVMPVIETNYWNDIKHHVIYTPPLLNMILQLLALLFLFNSIESSALQRTPHELLFNEIFIHLGYADFARLRSTCRSLKRDVEEHIVRFKLDRSEISRFGVVTSLQLKCILEKNRQIGPLSEDLLMKLARLPYTHNHLKLLQFIRACRQLKHLQFLLKRDNRAFILVRCGGDILRHGGKRDETGGGGRSECETTDGMTKCHGGPLLQNTRALNGYSRCWRFE